MVHCSKGTLTQPLPFLPLFKIYNNNIKYINNNTRCVLPNTGPRRPLQGPESNNKVESGWKWNSHKYEHSVHSLHVAFSILNFCFLLWSGFGVWGQHWKRRSVEVCCPKWGVDLSPAAAAETNGAGAQKHKRTVSQSLISLPVSLSNYPIINKIC